ncbi:MAG: TIGR04086 family membrane protein [Faecousia sp.]
MSLPAGLAVGALFSLGATLILAAVLAKLVESETIPVEKIGYGIMVLTVLSAFTGAMVSFRGIKRQRLLVCGVSGAIYFAILMSITALFFGGQYSAVGITALLVLGGSAAAALLGLRQSGGRKRTKIKVPHR